MREPIRVILGIDPGLALLGYGLIRAEGQTLEHIAHGCVSTPAGRPVPVRLRILFHELRQLRNTYPITDVALESLFHSRNVSTAVTVGQARGIAILAAVGDGVVFAEYTPTQVKQAVGGYGRARKPQMQQMVALLLNLPEVPSSDDAADALAVAICHAREAAVARVLAQARSEAS